jgi:DNA replication protein DnaC
MISYLTRVPKRIRTAHFPQVKTLEDFNLDHLPSLRRDEWRVAGEYTQHVGVRSIPCR